MNHIFLIEKYIKLLLSKQLFSLYMLLARSYENEVDLISL